MDIAHDHSPARLPPMRTPVPGPFPLLDRHFFPKAGPEQGMEPLRLSGAPSQRLGWQHARS